MIKFSIIIPTFNSEKTLDNALSSVVKQTCHNIEILIIDGLSSDSTLEIAKNYQKKFSYITIKSEKDDGVYDAMNKGIKHANGEWLYFMGSDDSFYEVKTLEKVFKHIEESKPKVFYGNVQIIGDAGWAKNGDIYDGEFTVEKLFNKNICHQAMFYNAEFIKKKIGDFNLNYSICSDWDFNLRCRAKTNFYYNEITIANFFSGGLSTKGTDKEFSIDYINNILKYFEINLFNELLNSPSFKRYAEVKTLQRRNYPYKFKFQNLRKRILKKLKIK